MNGKVEVREIIDVWHHRSNGYHKFTSPHVPGLLLVAEGGDLSEAFQEIPIVIAALVKADFGYDVSVSRESTCTLYHGIMDEAVDPVLLHFSLTKTAPD